ncbi:MAG: hypothetical protein ACFB0B_17720 [Thermonemataceae bacterium]
MTTYPDSLSQVMNQLKEEGYEASFDYKEGKLVDQHGQSYQANELIITQTHRFEGFSNPSDNTILYVLEAEDGNKGLYVASYSIYESEEEGERARAFFDKIEIKREKV